MTTTNTQNYKPTLMQNLLGRNYKWWFVLVQGFKSNTAYRLNSLAWLLSSVVLICGTLTVWYISFSQDNSFNLESYREIFTYLILGEAFIFSSAIQFEIGEDIQGGELTSKVLLPTSYLLNYFFKQFGYQLFENIAKLFLYMGILLTLNQYFIFVSINNLLLFFLACVMAYIINVLIGIIVGASAFWLTAFFGSAALFDNLRIVFSGRLFPLDKLKFLHPLKYSPLAFTFYQPMQIYLGKYSPIETFYVLLAGITWCFALFFLAKWIFKMGLKKNEAVGL